MEDSSIKTISKVKVTKAGQSFIIDATDCIVRGTPWKKSKVYICTKVIEFEGLDSEVYVGDAWISSEYTRVVNF